MKLLVPAAILLCATLGLAADSPPATQPAADAPELIAGLSKLPKDMWPAPDETAAQKQARQKWTIDFLLHHSGHKMHFSGELVACDIVTAVVPPPPGMRPPRGAPPPPAFVPPKLPTRLAVALTVNCGDVGLWGHTYHLKAHLVPAGVTADTLADSKWALQDKVKIDGPVGGLSFESADHDTIVVTIRDTATFSITPAAPGAVSPGAATRP